MAVELVAGSALSFSIKIFLRVIDSSAATSFLRGKKDSGFDGLLRKLKSEFLCVAAVLADAEKKQITNPNVKKWLFRLEFDAYDVDDLFDEITYNVLKLQVERCKGKVRNLLFTASNSTDHKWKIRMEKILGRLEDLKKQIRDLCLFAQIRDLCPDLIDVISTKLASFRDCVSMAGVNREFRYIMKTLQWKVASPPSLMLPEDGITLIRKFFRPKFFRPNDGTVVEFEVSEAQGKFTWGTPFGMLVVMDPYEQRIKLINIFSKFKLQLPTLPRSCMIDIQSFQASITKCSVLEMSTAEFIIATIMKPSTEVYLTKLKENSVVCPWIAVSNPDNYHFTDTTSFRGEMFALSDNGYLFKVIFQDSEKIASLKVLSSEIKEKTQRSYLVASATELYSVFRFRNNHGTILLKVYKFSFESLIWELEPCIGEKAFFIGNNTSWCIDRAESVGYQTDRIYFSDDYTLRESHQSGREYRDAGVFVMNSKRVIFFKDGQNASALSKATWVAHGYKPCDTPMRYVY